MLGFIDCGLLAKEIMMLFPDENNIAPDINSAIKSLSLILLGSDSNPSQSSQKNFCKTLRNIVEQLFKLQHSEQDYRVCEDSLSKIENLGQQAVDWRINFNGKNQFTTTEVEPVQQEKKKKRLDHDKDDNEKSAGKSSEPQQKKRAGRQSNPKRARSNKRRSKVNVSQTQVAKGRPKHEAKEEDKKPSLVEVSSGTASVTASIDGVNLNTDKPGPAPLQESECKAVPPHMKTCEADLISKNPSGLEEKETIDMTSETAPKTVPSSSMDVEEQVASKMGAKELQLDDKTELCLKGIEDTRIESSVSEENGEQELAMHELDVSLCDTNEEPSLPITDMPPYEGSEMMVDIGTEPQQQLSFSNYDKTETRILEANVEHPVEIPMENIDPVLTAEEICPIQDIESFNYLLSGFEGAYMQPRRAAVAAKLKIEASKRVSKRSSTAKSEQKTCNQADQATTDTTCNQADQATTDTTCNQADQATTDTTTWKVENEDEDTETVKLDEVSTNSDVLSKTTITNETGVDEAAAAKIKRERKPSKKMQDSIEAAGKVDKTVLEKRSRKRPSSATPVSSKTSGKKSISNRTPKKNDSQPKLSNVGNSSSKSTTSSAPKKAPKKFTVIKKPPAPKKTTKCAVKDKNNTIKKCETSAQEDDLEDNGEAKEGVGEAMEGVGEAREGVGEAEADVGEAQEDVGETEEGVGDQEAEAGVGEAEAGVREAEAGMGEAEAGMAEGQVDEEQKVQESKQTPEENTAESMDDEIEVSDSLRKVPTDDNPETKTETDPEADTDDDYEYAPSEESVSDPNDPEFVYPPKRIRNRKPIAKAKCTSPVPETIVDKAANSNTLPNVSRARQIIPEPFLNPGSIVIFKPAGMTLPIGMASNIVTTTGEIPIRPKTTFQATPKIDMRQLSKILRQANILRGAGIFKQPLFANQSVSQSIKIQVGKALPVSLSNVKVIPVTFSRTIIQPQTVLTTSHSSTTLGSQMSSCLSGQDQAAPSSNKAVTIELLQKLQQLVDPASATSLAPEGCLTNMDAASKLQSATPSNISLTTEPRPIILPTASTTGPRPETRPRMTHVEAAKQLQRELENMKIRPENKENVRMDEQSGS